MTSYSSEPELTRLTSLGMNGLFLAATLPHALIIGSVSLAALRTKTLPVLLIVLGGFQAVSGALGAFALPQTFEQGPCLYATFGLSFFAFALWYLGASIVLVAKSRQVRPTSLRRDLT